LFKRRTFCCGGLDKGGGGGGLSDGVTSGAGGNGFCLVEEFK
jgi:hypothetical protein